MLSLNNIKANNGSRKVSKRLGRGNGSGKGTYSGRGCNGQNCRAGGGVPSWFEGGQTPLFRRMPKLKGFKNSLFKKEFSLINLNDLNILVAKGISDINIESLYENKIIKTKKFPVKLLANGELTSAVTLKVNNASIKAKEIVEKAGGKLELV